LVYGDPITFIDTNPRGAVGQPERIALMTAYGEVQRYLTITGLCISVLLVIASLCLRNPRLGDQQSFQDAEGFEVSSVESEEEKREKRRADVGFGSRRLAGMP
jgi:SIT family siderophore-iron:H+ symporter-like MFS transporter